MVDDIRKLGGVAIASKESVMARCKEQGADLKDRIEFLASKGITYEDTPREWIAALDLMF